MSYAVTEERFWVLALAVLRYMISDMLYSHMLFFLFYIPASRDELQSRKVKLDYSEVGTCQKDALNIWDKKLLNCRAKIRCDMEDIHTTLKEGIFYVGCV